jgi:hypothetical protein
MSKQGTDGKMKHATLTISQKIETIRKLNSGESQRQVGYGFTEYCIINYVIKKWKDQL